MTGQTVVIIAHTVKGKGVSFVESDFTFRPRPVGFRANAAAAEELSHVARS